MRRSVVHQDPREHFRTNAWDRWKEFADSNLTLKAGQAAQPRSLAIDGAANLRGHVRWPARIRGHSEITGRKASKSRPRAGSEKTGPIRGRHCKLELIPRKELEGGSWVIKEMGRCPRKSDPAGALMARNRQRHLTPSCGGSTPTAERTVDPARTIVGELDTQTRN